MIERRQAMARRYHQLLAGIPGVQAPVEPDWAHSNWQSYCVWLAEEIDQRAVMQSMLDDGIATRRGVMCAHREEAYPEGSWSCGGGGEDCSCGPDGCPRLVESEKAQDHTIILPLFHQMTEEEQDYVVACLKKACL
jgi:dTDP-4-amino-4,6-dideoxygalactose transaminase